MYSVPIFSMTLRRRESRVGAMVKVIKAMMMRGWTTKATKRLTGVSWGTRMEFDAVSGEVMVGRERAV